MPQFGCKAIAYSHDRFQQWLQTPHVDVFLGFRDTIKIAQVLLNKKVISASSFRVYDNNFPLLNAQLVENPNPHSLIAPDFVSKKIVRN